MGQIWFSWVLFFLCYFLLFGKKFHCAYVSSLIWSDLIWSDAIWFWLWFFFLLQLLFLWKSLESLRLWTSTVLKLILRFLMCLTQLPGKKRFLSFFFFFLIFPHSFCIMEFSLDCDLQGVPMILVIMSEISFYFLGEHCYKTVLGWCQRETFGCYWRAEAGFSGYGKQGSQHNPKVPTFFFFFFFFSFYLFCFSLVSFCFLGFCVTNNFGRIILIEIVRGDIYYLWK